MCCAKLYSLLIYVMVFLWADSMDPPIPLAQGCPTYSPRDDFVWPPGSRLL